MADSRVTEKPNNTSHILIINSYHQGFKWTDDIVAAVIATISADLDNVEFHVEYMDSKRHPGSRHYDMLSKTLALKYQRLQPNIIIASDDNALNFLKEHHQELFPKVPVIFCGINNVEKALSIDRDNFTGLVETLDMSANIELAKQLLPETSEIVIVSDGSPTGIGTRQMAIDAEHDHPDMVFTYLNGEELSTVEMLSRLRQLTKNSVVIAPAWYFDRNGNTYDNKTIYPRIVEASPVPVLGTSSANLGFGILGGKLNSGTIQGEYSGRLALRILSGTATTKDIPVETKSQNLYMFDHWQLTHFDISKRRLPTDAKIINVPIPFYQHYKIESAIALVAFLSLLVIIVFLLWNIRRRKQAEDERNELESQLRQSQKIESIGQLAGGVAHDFNNMLSAILGHSELAMLQCTPSGTVHSHIKGIQEAAHRSSDLVSQLLAFARKQTIAPKILNVNDMSSSMLNMLKRLIGEDIELTWSPGSDLWKIKMDPSQIDQIVMNLCVNARDSICGVGKITIETKNTTFSKNYCSGHVGFVPGDFVMLAISDNGSGMSKEVQEHIFEPFYTTKNLGKGTGLGLATVYGIVRQNGGFINVYSEVDKGSTFRIYLPRVIGEDIAQTVETISNVPEGKGETILLVEDESAILKVAQTMLEELGFVVLIADTPEEAITIAKTHSSKIDLLITDVVMPEMNGRDLAKEIRNIRPEVKCMFTSGYTANVIARHGVLDEGVYFLSKPFSMKNLALKINQTLTNS